MIAIAFVLLVAAHGRPKRVELLSPGALAAIADARTRGRAIEGDGTAAGAALLAQARAFEGPEGLSTLYEELATGSRAS